MPKLTDEAFHLYSKLKKLSETNEPSETRILSLIDHAYFRFVRRNKVWLSSFKSSKIRFENSRVKFKASQKVFMYIQAHSISASQVRAKASQERAKVSQERDDFGGFLPHHWRGK